jgi:hypothetical protein
MLAQRPSIFIVVLLLSLSNKSFSQQLLPRIEQNSPHILSQSEISVGVYQPHRRHLFSRSSIEPCLQTGQYALQHLLFTKYQVVNPVPAKFYTSKLSFFCSKEFQFEKKTSIPLRLRVGSLEYTDMMEGKGRNW